MQATTADPARAPTMYVARDMTSQPESQQDRETKTNQSIIWNRQNDS